MGPFLLLTSCARGGRTGAHGEASSIAVEMRATKDHPALSVVERSGDPAGGLAVAVAMDGGARAATALGHFIALRLRSQGVHDAEVTPFGTGFVVTSLALGASAAERFASAVQHALGTPVSAKSPIGRLRSTVARSGIASWNSLSEEAVGRCSAALGERGQSKPLTARALESWRRAAYSRDNVAFSVTGTEALTHAAARALARTDAWPTAGSLEDPWPERDVIGVGPASGSTRRLVLALREADGARVLGAARRLSERDSTLALRLRALESPWHIDQITGLLRPRGACLTLELSREIGSPEPDMDEVGGVLQLAFHEAQVALRAAGEGGFPLDEGILTAGDPRRAAAIAAWRAVSEQLRPGPPRKAAHYGVPANDASAEASQRFRSAFEKAEETWTTRTVQIVSRDERGQGELWLLLASPCGTSPETTATAGRGALTLRALASNRSRHRGVVLEPWIATDGLGLVAHAPPRSYAESSNQHAARVARELGRALAAARIAENDAAGARSELLESLQATRDPQWAAALAALAPGHPSFLDPRGTWDTVTAQSTHALELQREAFLRGALRLAILTNDGPDQADVAARVLSETLRPARRSQYRCPAVVAPVARPGEYAVDSRSTPDEGIRALVAVSILPRPLEGIPREAEWTALLLNRPGGWLEQALSETGLTARAEASVLGGAKSAALVVELSVLGDQRRAAVEQVRGLFERLSRGIATQKDVALARRTFATLDRAASLDPRRRLVELWRQAPNKRKPDRASLNEFLARTFAPSRHVVVVPAAEE